MLDNNISNYVKTNSPGSFKKFTDELITNNSYV